MITFTSPGNPIGKGRPRFARGRTYTPKRTVDAEMVVEMAALKAYPNFAAITGPVQAVLVFHMRIPPSWPKGKQETARHNLIRPASTPDLDNLIKLVGDAIQPYIILDDKQIVTITAHKGYSDTPGTEITIIEL